MLEVQYLLLNETRDFSRGFFTERTIQRWPADLRTPIRPGWVLQGFALS